MSDFNNYNYNYDNDNFDPKNNSIFEGEGMPVNNGPMNGPENGPARAPKKAKKNKRKGGAFAKVAAYALVFGLVAGGTTYGVNRAAVTLAGTGTTSEASASAGTDSTGSTAAGTTANQIGTTNTVTTASKTSGDTSVSTVTANAMPSLVTITSMSVQELRSVFGGTQQYESQGAGTGIIVGENDDEILIATNNHVIEGATELSVGFVDETAASASIKGTDAENDLAVIAVKKADLAEDTLNQIKVIAIGDSDSLQLGEQVVAIGNALGYGQSVTSGYVSALNRELSMSDGTTTYNSTGLIQTDAAINPGNSGGALINMNGELIGINEAKSSTTSSGATVDNMGFAIPITKALPILQDLMNQETKEVVDEANRGYLGIGGADVTSDYSQMYNMPVGLYITNVGEDSPAAQAGLQTGDILVKFDGQSVGTVAELQNLMRYYAAGDTVDIVIDRAGNNGQYEEQTITVTLGSK